MKGTGMPEGKTPQTAAEWFDMGRRCFHQPDGMGAIRAMERVIELDPAYKHSDGDNPHFYLGKIHEMENRIETAIMHYCRALAVDPNDEESLIGRGSCYTVTRQHDLAVSDFVKLLKVPDRFRKVPRKHLLYAIAENYRQAENWVEAVFWGKQALEADPDNQRPQQLVQEAGKNLGH
jgi:tetratricopeptide (TPR) repeat protein